jgi:hypothetical protein
MMDAPLMVNGRYCLHYFGTWMPLGEVGVHSISYPDTRTPADIPPNQRTVTIGCPCQ